MEIFFSNRKLKRQLSDPKETYKAFGQMARKIKQRLSELESADNLSVMKTLPAARCHELKGNRKGQLAVDIIKNYRIVFKPAYNPLPLKDDGSLDWIQVSKIEILKIEDYH